MLMYPQEILQSDWHYGNNINHLAFSHLFFSWIRHFTVNLLGKRSRPVFGEDHPLLLDFLFSVCPHNSDLILWSAHSQTSRTECMLLPQAAQWCLRTDFWVKWEVKQRFFLLFVYMFWIQRQISEQWLQMIIFGRTDSKYQWSVKCEQ